MKARVRPAQKKDLDSIVLFLHANHDPRLSPQQWRRLFEYPDVGNQPNLGFLLESNNQLVGFLGAIYSERSVGGLTERFCNLTSWYVFPEFRASSIELLMALLNQKGYTFINLAPSEIAGKLMLRCGFQPLEWHKLLCGPRSCRAFVERKRKSELCSRFCRFSRHLEFLIEAVYLTSLKFFYKFSSARVSTPVHLIVGADSIRPMLSDSDQRLLDDHRHCGHFLISDGNAYSYIVTVNRKIYFRRRTPTDFIVSDLLHVSDHELTQRNWDQLCQHIIQNEHSHAVTADERLFTSCPTEGLRLPCRSYFRSPSGVSPIHVDSLYTEVPFLDVLIYA